MPTATPTGTPTMNSEAVRDHFWTAIGNALKDLSRLDVVSMTGALPVNLADAPPKDFDELITKLKTSSTPLQVVAISRYEIDYDALLFVKQELSASEQKILDFHLQTVKSAQEMRAKVVELVATALLSIVK